MTTQRQIRGAPTATQEARTLASRELDIDTTHKRVNVHDGSTVGGTPHVTFADEQNQEFTYAAATGTNAIVLTLANAPASYVAGQRFSFKAQNTTTSSATINVNSLGAKTLKKKNRNTSSLTALVAGDIIQNAIYSVVYNGTDFIVESIDSGSAATKASYTVSTALNSIEFDGVFEVGKNYEVRISNLSLDTTTYFGFLLGNGGVYSTSYNGFTAFGKDTSGVTQSVTSETGSIIRAMPTTMASSDYADAIIWLMDPAGGSGHCKMQWSICYEAAGGDGVQANGFGQKTGTFTDFAVATTSSDEIDAGVITITEMDQ